MVDRSVARARWRCFGWFAVLATALTLCAARPAAAPASSEATLAASQTVIGISLARVATGKEALSIRGASVGPETALFSAVAAVSRFPCPGSYRYSLQSENPDTGAQSSYAATVALAPLEQSRDTLCGFVPPTRPGTLRVSISGDEEAIGFGLGRQRGSEGFFGDLTMGTQPVCDQRYTLSVDADLRGWSRSVRYRFKVASWKSEALGRELETAFC